MIKYLDFKAEGEERGYIRMSQVGNVLVLYTKNNVKAEIKKKHYTLGWLRTEDEIKTLQEALLEARYSLSTKRSDASKCVTISFVPGKNILSEFWKLVEIIEGIEGIVYRERGQAKKVFTREIAETNIFYKIAKTYKFAIDEQHQLLLDQGRDLLEADSIDHILVVGESVKHTDKESYREHIVPCVLIHNRIIELISEGCSVTEVANFIKSHNAIVLITNEEARKMDVDLGLRTSMPAGWNWGDDIFARLKEASIKLK